MKNQLIELLQKDIEVFRFCVSEEGLEIFSDHNFELSSIKFVARFLSVEIGEDILELGVEYALNEELSSLEVAQKYFNQVFSLS